MEHLLSSVDYLRSKHPDIGILITGDFNRMNMFQLINGNDLSQIVDFPTRGKATLDPMLTSGNLRECYEKPIPLSPLGLSDHSCVIWKPENHRVAKYEHKAQITRPLPWLLESGMQTFGSWIQSLDWHQVLEATGIQNKADAFYEILDLGMNTCFPEKKKRVHTNEKSWITPHIKNLIAKRQQAFISGNDQEWRKLRNEVKREIEKAKVNYHANRIRDLQKTESRKWYQQIKKVTKSGRSELRLNVPGVLDDDEKGKADAVNDCLPKYLHMSLL